MILKIGKIQLRNNILLAPMAGFTDIGMRMLCRRYGAGLTYTEMVSAQGLVYGSEKTRELLALDASETPSAVQIFGSKPDIMAAAVELLSQFDIIDINMGCPVQKIVKSGEGSALMNDPDRAEKIVRACALAAKGRPVTVKMRAGFSRENLNAPLLARICEDNGASAVTVHGRTRAEFYSGKADWNIIREVAGAVKIPVIGNGDIETEKDVGRATESGCAGVMAGRAAIGRPQIFTELQGGHIEINTGKLILEHIRRLQSIYPEKYIVANIRKFIPYYFKGRHGAKTIKEKFNKAINISQLEEIAYHVSE